MEFATKLWALLKSFWGALSDIGKLVIQNLSTEAATIRDNVKNVTVKDTCLFVGKQAVTCACGVAVGAFMKHAIPNFSKNVSTDYSNAYNKETKGVDKNNVMSTLMGNVFSFVFFGKRSSAWTPPVQLQLPL